MCAEVGAKPDEVVSKLLHLQDDAYGTGYGAHVSSATSYGSRVAEAEMAQAAVVTGGAIHRDVMKRVVDATEGQSIEELAASIRFAESMRLNALNSPEVEEAGVRLRNLRVLLARLMALSHSSCLASLGEAIHHAALHGITDWPELSQVQRRRDLLVSARKRLLDEIPSRHFLDARPTELEAVILDCESLGLMEWAEYKLAKDQLFQFQKHVSCMKAPGKPTTYDTLSKEVTTEIQGL